MVTFLKIKELKGRKEKGNSHTLQQNLRDFTAVKLTGPGKLFRKIISKNRNHFVNMKTSNM